MPVVIGRDASAASLVYPREAKTISSGHATPLKPGDRFSLGGQDNQFGVTLL